MRTLTRVASLLLLSTARAWAGDVAAVLHAAADQNKASLRAFAAGGCDALKGGGPRVLELKFLGGQTARLLVVDVARHGELLDVTFFTPGTTVLATRSLKVRPGAPPLWITADGKKFPVEDDLSAVPIAAAEFAAVRARTETAPCYVARLAQEYVRPREFAEAASGDASH